MIHDAKINISVNTTMRLINFLVNIKSFYINIYVNKQKLRILDAKSDKNKPKLII